MTNRRPFVLARLPRAKLLTVARRALRRAIRRRLSRGHPDAQYDRANERLEHLAYAALWLAAVEG